ncbi:Zn(2)-C6 fungal-type domain-containing protein [Fusarium keratoplasticum]|nr:Zn(2)-C6 fungal-type domain-containing protein [Fusarium keratoplasticum]
MAAPRITKSTGLASLACTGCRKQHLKCDGKKPTCSRCVQNGTPCNYQPSRRGGRRKPRDLTAGRGLQPLRPSIGPGDDDSVSASSPTVPEVPRSEPSRLSATDDAPSDGNVLSYFSGISTDHLLWPGLGPKDFSNQGQVSSISRPPTDSERFIRMYYENFHNAHPILVPASMYTSRAYPTYLQLVVDFAGSHYVQLNPSEQLKTKVATELSSSTDKSACMVQAWLIYAIVLFSRGDLTEAQDAFSHCTTIAFDIGLHRADYASSQHPERSIEAESLRRTWWELFITDVIMALPQKTISFRCSAVCPEVPLPCEESLYTGTHDIPEPRRILDFKRRVLFEEDIIFSSFSYRIEAISILGRVLVLNRLRDYHRDHLQAVENALVSWSNHLPTKKLDIVDSYGNIDEIMFQAHAMIAYAGMLLHLPRSSYHPHLCSNEDPFWPMAQAQSLSSSTRLVHSIKATEASRRISDYISLCPNIQKHTPCIIPALVLCGLIQLATSNSHSDECFDHHYNRITLILGCLKNLKRTWNLADSAYHRVRSCAATLISESMDRWNSEPLSKSIALTTSTPSESGQANNRPADSTVVQGAQETTIPELDPSFIDRLCYSSSLFSSLPDFEIS